MNLKKLHIKGCGFLLIIIFLLASSVSSYAQYYFIDGETSLYENGFETYNILDSYGQPPVNPNSSYFTWNTTIGSMQSTSGYGVITMPIQFGTSGSGAVYVDWFDNFMFQYYYLQLPVEVTAYPPSTPNAPTVLSNNCNATILQRGNPPTGVTWYWQSIPSGTSTFDSNQTKTVTSGAIYYLRARDDSSGVWSIDSSSITYTIDAPPIWYADTDSDGFGDPNVSTTSCAQPTGYVSNNFDECPTQTGNPLNNGCPGAGDPGSTDKSYVHTVTPLIPVSDVSQIVNDNDKIEQVTYFDGLGRPIQNVGIRAGGQNEDIKIPLIYDEFGRQSKMYLPHATTTSSSLTYTNNISLINSINTYYLTKHPNQLNSNNPNPYSEKRFENSPLSRTLESGSSGEDWLIDANSDNDHTTKFEYNSNTSNDVYDIDYPGPGQSLSISSFYPEGVLLKNTVKNENWVTADGKINTKDVFTDKSGKKIAEYSYIIENTILQTLKTYYVYDSVGNLVYILTPKIFSIITGTVITVSNLNDLAFQYKYDIYNRQIEQKIPGKKQWEYVVYDLLDRPILTQDENLKSEGKWLFTKYDALGRSVYSGLFTDGSSRATLQATVDGYINGNPSNLSNVESRTGLNSINGVTISYTNNAFPTTNLDLLTVNFYDDYNFADPDKPTVPTTVRNQVVTTRTKGLPTASWTRVIGTTKWNKNYIFYDEKARPVRISERNYLGGYTGVDNEYDFRGKINDFHTVHYRANSANGGGPLMLISDHFEYDHMERLTAHYQSPFFNNEQRIAENIYNELGQLTQKKIGGATNSTPPLPLQTLDYTYDIRGALKSVNDVDNMGNDLFAYELNYETGEGTNYNAPQYNGNISQVIWKSAFNNGARKSYFYDYDDLNRFKKGRYGEGTNLDTNWQRFEVNVNGYDHNGNITGLTRRSTFLGGSTIIDDLNYNYDTGNQLLKITDTGTISSIGFKDGTNGADDYTYDNNGNLTQDLNKDISLIEYNHLDLVTKVTFTDGKTIGFLYDASGTKLKMEYNDGANTTKTDYLGAFQYQNNVIQFYQTPSGYARYDGPGTYAYVYTLSDHLGNNRVTFENVNGTNIILSNTDYYPMGLTHIGEYIANSNYNYKYQGKEQLKTNGYNMYDFGSRMYDASVGRWFNTDPQNQFGSPYLAMGNNWVVSVDPDGEFVLEAALIGAAIGTVMNGLNNTMNEQPFFKGALKAAGIGALGGVASYGIGEAATALANSGWSQFAVGSFQAGAHALSGGTLSELGGGKFINGAISGSLSSVVGSTVSYYGGGASDQIFFGSLAAGLGSELTGGGFVNGFGQGLISSALNHGAHEIEYQLTKARLIKALRKAGLCSACTNKEIGSAFERIVQLRYSEAGIDLSRGELLQSIFGNTIPDFYHTLEGNITGDPYPMGALVEVKAKNAGSSLGLFSQKGQLFKQIFAHSQLLWKAGYTAGGGSHTIVTTAGVKVSPKIRWFAQQLGVQSSHYYSVYKGKLSIENINFRKNY